ncbi:uncharacterized protein UTRI_05484_B [Ustilago trichophora]|uniref:Transmembrane protein n=1 Tax=Ustilago trichophora TaxID=86804 RepID=A0A5C3EMG9_9BASI|nr:uncharacterized protein UTRI_05484_B [Ustilago trichophora]
MSTISNSTNTTPLPTTSLAANSSNIAATNIVTNATSNSQNEAMVTLLTFGPLSSCIRLPDLAAKSLPDALNLSSTAQSQIVQSWIASLPTTSSCTRLSWTFKPDYSDHLNSMATFQSHLEQLFPVGNSTEARTSKAVTSSAMRNAPVSTGTAGVATASVASFLGGAPGVISGSSATLPTGLPLWIAVVIASSALVHLLTFIIHIGSDLDALFPSFAAKLQNNPQEPILPNSTLSSNESSTTLIDTKTPPSEPEAKVAQPPSYTEPVTTQCLSSIESGPKPTPVLMRYSRKAKKLTVPLLLLSALGTIAVAVVVNSKFAAGPVGYFPTSLSPGVGGDQMPSFSTNMAAANASGYGGSSTSQNPSIIPSSSPNTTTKMLDSDRASTNVQSAATATRSMTKLVRRQITFFPTPSDMATVRPTSTASLSSFNTTSSSAPIPTTTTADSSPNASLFPPTPTPTPTPTVSPSITTTQPLTTTSTIESNSNNPLFIVVKSDSIHRLWWIVILDLLLWFAQRRRARCQTSMDKARRTILAQLSLPKNQPLAT